MACLKRIPLKTVLSSNLILISRCQHHHAEVVATFSNGRQMTLSSGKLARFADGSSVSQSGETSVMVTAVSRNKLSSNASFTPLTVDYRQKAAAAGRIPTNFFRRELGPTEKEILTGRLIDRSIRPLFFPGYYYDTQLVCNLLAVDGNNDPDILSLNAASAALTVSDIPWNGPIGAVRIGIIDNEFIVNPTRRELSRSQLDLVVACTEKKSVIMMEGYASRPIVLNDLMKAIKKAIKETQTVIKAINELKKKIGKTKRTIEDVLQPSPEEVSAVQSLAENRLREVFSTYSHDKISRDVELNQIRIEVMEKLKDDYPERMNILNDVYTKLIKKVYKDLVFETDKRCDGRTISQLRDISCQIELYKPLHGSSLFQRGQTQVLCTVSFDSLDSALKYDPVSIITTGLKEKNFMLHYEFPSYATNEIGRGSSFGRRELGHGALAEKSLRAVIPQEFPFTIRLTCEVLESNGSSSMASVCAGSLALMDAGVEISSPVAGVAMGLLSDEKEDAENELNNFDYRILTDISGLEDYFGHMDFKVAGPLKGFTGLQLDVKRAGGLPGKIVMEALQKSNDAKSEILSIMNSEISEARKDKKSNWPISKNLHVPPNKRAKFLGFGGYNLKKLSSQTGVHLTQDPENAEQYILFAPNQEALTEAFEIINELLKDDDEEMNLEFGGIYPAKIVEIRENGVMITFYNSMKPTLLHVKELDMRTIAHPSALNLEVGQEIQVKYFGRDPHTGHMRVSRRVIQMIGPISKTLSNK